MHGSSSPPPLLPILAPVASLSFGHHDLFRSNRMYPRECLKHPWIADTRASAAIDTLLAQVLFISILDFRSRNGLTISSVLLRMICSMWNEVARQRVLSRLALVVQECVIIWYDELLLRVRVEWARILDRPLELIKFFVNEGHYASCGNTLLGTGILNLVRSHREDVWKCVNRWRTFKGLTFFGSVSCWIHPAMPHIGHRLIDYRTESQLRQIRASRSAEIS